MMYHPGSGSRYHVLLLLHNSGTTRRGPGHHILWRFLRVILQQYYRLLRRHWRTKRFYYRMIGVVACQCVPIPLQNYPPLFSGNLVRILWHWHSLCLKWYNLRPFNNEKYNIITTRPGKTQQAAVWKTADPIDLSLYPTRITPSRVQGAGYPPFHRRARAAYARATLYSATVKYLAQNDKTFLPRAWCIYLAN